MLYLMLVLVFSKLSKKWWFFILVGWGKQFQNVSILCTALVMIIGLPVIVVAVAAGLQYENYGDPERGLYVHS